MKIILDKNILCDRITPRDQQSKGNPMYCRYCGTETNEFKHFACVPCWDERYDKGRNCFYGGPMEYKGVTLQIYTCLLTKDTFSVNEAEGETIDAKLEETRNRFQGGKK